MWELLHTGKCNKYLAFDLRFGFWLSAVTSIPIREHWFRLLCSGGSDLYEWEVAAVVFGEFPNIHVITGSELENTRSRVLSYVLCLCCTHLVWEKKLHSRFDVVGTRWNSWVGRRSADPRASSHRPSCRVSFDICGGWKRSDLLR
jgi:hypothetical protein